MGHYSERVRREALKGLQDLLTHNPGELRQQVGWLQDSVLQVQKGCKPDGVQHQLTARGALQSRRAGCMRVAGAGVAAAVQDQGRHRTNEDTS